MKQIKRTQLQTLEAIMNGERLFIQVLLGPRQVGKTTMVRQLLEGRKSQSLYVSADDIGLDNQEWIDTVWQQARIMYSANGGYDFILAIDEIQKIEQWSESVKKNWDADTAAGVNIKLIVLGSSRLLVQKGLSESLMGRYEKHYIPHWSFLEMEEAFGIDLNSYIWHGAYPGSAALFDNESRWKSYIKEAIIEASISKDILMMGRIDKPILLRKLFELGSLYSSQILSFTKILGQLKDAGNTTTLANYLQMMDTSGLMVGLEKFSLNKIKLRSSSPKFQVQNNALMTAISAKTFTEALNEKIYWGRLTESAVGAFLYNQSLVENYSVYYWRDGNEEIDFVLEKGGKIVCVEVKSHNEKASMNNGKFIKQYPNSKNLIIGGANGLPLELFFRMNPMDLFI